MTYSKITVQPTFEGINLGLDGSVSSYNLKAPGTKNKVSEFVSSLILPVSPSKKKEGCRGLIGEYALFRQNTKVVDGSGTYNSNLFAIKNAFNFLFKLRGGIDDDIDKFMPLANAINAWSKEYNNIDKRMRIVPEISNLCQSLSDVQDANLGAVLTEYDKMVKYTTLSEVLPEKELERFKDNLEVLENTTLSQMFSSPDLLEKIRVLKVRELTGINLKLERSLVALGFSNEAFYDKILKDTPEGQKQAVSDSYNCILQPIPHTLVAELNELVMNLTKLKKLSKT